MLIDFDLHVLPKERHDVSTSPVLQNLKLVLVFLTTLHCNDKGFAHKPSAERAIAKEARAKVTHGKLIDSPARSLTCEADRPWKVAALACDGQPAIKRCSWGARQRYGGK